MSEIWDEWNATRDKNKTLKDDYRAIAEKCAKDHGKAHITACKPCYDAVVELFANRYLVASRPEWFSGRRRFRNEIRKLFADARAYKVDLRQIERRLKVEKRNWYVETVTGAKARLIAGDVAGKEHVLAKLRNGRMPLHVLIKDVRELLTRDPSQSPDAAAFFEKVADAPTPAARHAIYKEALFGLNALPEVQPASAAKSPEAAKAQAAKAEAAAAKPRQKYFDMVVAGKPLDQVVIKMLADRKALDARIRDRRSSLEKRLETLHRGRKTHEAQKRKKAKAMAVAMEKDSIVVAPPPLADELYRLPPCFTCEKEMDSKEFVQCLYCQLFSMWRTRGVTVYCDVECHDQGFSSHEKDHVCAAGPLCERFAPAGAPPNRDRDNKDISVVFCFECIRMHKLPTMYCKESCMARDFQRHREEVHIPARKKIGSTRDDRGLLEYKDPEMKTYVAKNLASLMIPLAKAIDEWEIKYRAPIEEKSQG